MIILVSVLRYSLEMHSKGFLVMYWFNFLKLQGTKMLAKKIKETEKKQKQVKIRAIM